MHLVQCRKVDEMLTKCSSRGVKSAACLHFREANVRVEGIVYVDVVIFDGGVVVVTVDVRGHCRGVVTFAILYRVRGRVVRYFD